MPTSSVAAQRRSLPTGGPPLLRARRESDRAVFPLLGAFSGMRVGISVAVGGVSCPMGAFYRLLREHEGGLRTGVVVGRILVAGGSSCPCRACRRGSPRSGTCCGGERLTNGPRSDLLAPSYLPDGTSRGLERYAVWPVHGDGPFALPKPMLCDASDELQRFAYVHVAPRVDDPARTYADALEGCWPSHSSWSAGRARSTLYKLRRVVKCRGARCDRCRPSCGTARLALWPEGVGMRRRRPPRIGSWRRRSVMRPVWARLSLTGRVLCAADFERHNRNPGRGDTVASSMHRRQNGAIPPAPGMARYRAHGGIPAVLGAATCVGRDRNAQSGHRTARDLFARARWQNLFRQEQHWWQSRRVSW